MIYLAVIICLVGLFIYLANSNPVNPKQEIGRIMFFAGLLAFLLISYPAVDAFLHVSSHR
jgi:hypothetical protein